MDREMEILRAIGSDVRPAGGEVREAIRLSVITALAREGGRKDRRRGFLARRPLAVIAAALVVPAAVAVASGLNSDVADTLDGFISGADEGHPIGRLVEPTDNPPSWWGDEGFTEQRVLASTGEHHLFAGRDEAGHVSFALDGGIGVTSASAANPFIDDFQGHSVVPLFGAPAGGPDTLLIAGLVADDVASVEVRYDSGSPDIETVNGSGFIFAPDLGRVESEGGRLVVDRWPTEIAVFDADGNELEAVPAMCVVGMPALALRSDPGRYYFASCEEEGAARAHRR